MSHSKNGNNVENAGPCSTWFVRCTFLDDDCFNSLRRRVSRYTRMLNTLSRVRPSSARITLSRHNNSKLETVSLRRFGKQLITVPPSYLVSFKCHRPFKKRTYDLQTHRLRSDRWNPIGQPREETRDARCEHSGLEKVCGAMCG